ncbi:MAG: beta-propeller domain-containing protein [Candidatus Bathyarchaeota archaeon]|nr:beta-propeller domain-containing protein [Candidatus Bathyarchaeota archaeon]
MQREIKRRIPIYGLAAVLLAIMLGTLVYNIQIRRSEKTPEMQTTEEQVKPAAQLLKTFASYDELRAFLMTNSKMLGNFPFLGPLDVGVFGFRTSKAGIAETPAATLEAGVDYSTTNVQVAGVDEADDVKTDGNYIYLTANNSVFIVKAYPPKEAKVISVINFKDAYLAGIFINADSSRLAVLGSRYPAMLPTIRFFNVDVKTFVYVYDITEKANPTLKRNFTMSGSYFSSRMIGKYVYTVVSQPAYIIFDTVILPKIYDKDGIKEIEASKIYYSNVSEDYYAYTTVAALNVLDEAEKPNTLTILMGSTSSMYVSPQNIYITFHESPGETMIYRIRINEGELSIDAKGTVRGRELNQFSMDEHKGYFRIATTTWDNEETQNNVYILDMNLNVVGKLENIATNETIDSARFMGNRCYLTTSIARKDPFFVIDISNPGAPKVLGYLKIPGFTRYLHPYDDEHIIGVGVNEDNKVKISIFDVTNVNNPIELEQYVAEGKWTYTTVLEDHKAFLFSKEKELLAMPIYIYDQIKGLTWQGIYVLKITSSYELYLKGRITHSEKDPWDSSYHVKRALYIENVLYALSERQISIHNITDLSLMNTITLF